MPNTSDRAPYRPFSVPPITDRDHWTRLDREPQFRPVIAALDKQVEAARAVGRPHEPLASDFLAAKRSNDRARIDAHWQNYRGYLGALTLRRCRLGIDANDRDDLLLDWLWSLLNTPTWCASAHLPNNDLPEGGQHRLDLAQCEMAANLAETLEAIRPWMEAQSATLAKTVLYEIDRRVLTPFAEGVTDGWWGRSAGHVNNWTGVCAGSVLAACESLARQGFPRPAAKARALDYLRLFAERAFTPAGECDEGAGYWLYGVGFACVGWGRLSPDELARELDMNRLREIAGYPGRSHLFGDTFFSGNDAGLQASASPFFVPWLAAATGDAFLKRWPVSLANLRNFSVIARTIDALANDPRLLDRPPLPTSDVPARKLDDQQVAIFSTTAKNGRRVIACLSGGTNGERHNHNDLGHFLVTVDERIIVPDLGAPHYNNDFFGPKRYTYLSASSRGHCCPIVDGHEQRAGGDARGLLIGYEPQEMRFALDLATAYPPEAGLKRWTRALQLDAATGAVHLDDAYTARRGAAIGHVVWSLDEPHKTSDASLQVGPMTLTFSPAPRALVVERIDPKDHLLRMTDWLKAQQKDGPWIYRIQADYVADDKGELKVESTFTP